MDPIRSLENSSDLNVAGDIVVKCRAEIRKGIYLQVNQGTTLEIGDKIFIGDNVTIICAKTIQIGQYTRIGNNHSFMDTDFYYIEILLQKLFMLYASPLKLSRIAG